jgi:hypothetical protein
VFYIRTSPVVSSEQLSELLCISRTLCLVLCLTPVPFMVIGMGSGVIPTPSCSSRLHYTINHEDCRRKQQKIERKLEETQILLQDMQERTAKMEEKIDMLMALVRLENFSNIIYFFTHTHKLIVIMGMIIV